MDTEEKVKLKNDELNVKLRRCENTLALSGLGVFMFAVWSMLHMVLDMLTNNRSIQKLTEDTADMSEPMIILMWILFGAVAFFSVVLEMLSRYYIMKSAAEDSKRKKNRTAYLVLTGFLIILYVFYIYVASSGLMDMIETAGLIDICVNMFFNVASLVVLTDLFVAGIRVKVIRKKLAKEE